MSAQSVQQKIMITIIIGGINAVAPYAPKHDRDRDHDHLHVHVHIDRAVYRIETNRPEMTIDAREIRFDGIPATKTRQITIEVANIRATMSAKVHVPYHRPKRMIGVGTLTRKVTVCAEKLVHGIMA